MDKKLIIGVVQVLLGAISYGLLATFVRIAYNEGFTTVEVTFAQYFFGFVVLGTVYLLKSVNLRPSNLEYIQNPGSFWKLILGGSTLGLTGFFYYLSVLYLPVSICVVLLMQSIWMGVVLESIKNRRRLEHQKIISCILVLLGTVLATGALETATSLQPLGLFYGVFAALLLTISLLVFNQTALELPVPTRSFYIIIGSFSAITIVAFSSLITDFNFGIFTSWGIVLGLFGSILPPVLYSSGMPKTGLGVGAVLTSAEIPVSVSMAAIVLDENVDLLQWAGVMLIITAIILLNLRPRFNFSAKEK